MARFTLPRDLYHGKGALEALKTLKLQHIDYIQIHPTTLFTKKH